MLKYLMKLRSRKAFTLVELVIVVAILALLMACVAAFATPVRDMVKATAASVDSLTANKIIGDYIENRLAYASRIDVHTAVNSSTASTDIADSFNSFQAEYAYAFSANALTKDKAGILIFHFEEDTTDPLKNTYKVYDVKIDSSGSYASTVFDASGNMNGEVFDDAFYVNSQNLIIAPVETVRNRVRNSHYITFDIIPFDCEEDYPTIHLKSDTLNYYYAYQANHKADPVTYPDETFGLSTLAEQRSGGVETISFELQNIAVDDATNWKAKSPSGAGGSDILIFYYTKHY